MTAFIVEREWEGVDVGRIDHKMGVRGIDTGELVLSDAPGLGWQLDTDYIERNRVRRD